MSLTRRISGIALLNVHSWLFTKESVAYKFPFKFSIIEHHHLRFWGKKEKKTQQW